MLAGKTVLIIEAELIISMSMQAVLHDLGATDIILMKSPDECRRAAHSWDQVALAILEIEAGRPDQLDLALAALRSGIPVIALTADGQLASRIPGLPDLPILVKPVPDDRLVGAVAALFHHPENQNV